MFIPCPVHVCLSVLSVCPVSCSVTLVYCGQTVGWIKTKLSTQVGLGPGHIVIDGDPAPPPQKKEQSQFLAHFYCGQTVLCINMPLGTEVGLGPGDFVLNGDPAPLPKRGVASNFRPKSIVAIQLDGSRCHLARR